MTKKDRKKDKRFTEDDLKNLSPKQKLEAIKLAQVSKMAAARYLRIAMEQSQSRSLVKTQAVRKSPRVSNSKEGDCLRVF